MRVIILAAVLAASEEEDAMRASLLVLGQFSVARGEWGFYTFLENVVHYAY
jgi:hypothetical protein